MSPPLLLTNCGSRTEGDRTISRVFLLHWLRTTNGSEIFRCNPDLSPWQKVLPNMNHWCEPPPAALLKHQFPAKAIGGFNEKRVFNKTMTLDLCPIVADMLNEICWTLFKLENLKTIIFIRAMGMRRAWFCLSIECLRDAFVRIQGLNAKLPSEQPQDLILLQLS